MEINYEVYDDDLFDDPKTEEEVLFKSRDAFKALGFIIKRDSPHWLVELVGSRTDKGFQAHIEQAFHVGGSLEIRHEGTYNTIVLYTDSPSEFFKDSTLEFRLWEVMYGRNFAQIVDFTNTYDSTMILSLFGNRLKLRLNKITEVSDDRKSVLARSAHYAIVYKEEKNKFL